LKSAKNYESFEPHIELFPTKYFDHMYSIIKCQSCSGYGLDDTALGGCDVGCMHLSPFLDVASEISGRFSARAAVAKEWVKLL
jgi:hypothetical protein